MVTQGKHEAAREVSEACATVGRRGGELPPTHGGYA